MIRRETLFVVPGCCVQVSAVTEDRTESSHTNGDRYKGYNMKNINDMVVSKEVVKEKSALLERLRQLESENSALVLENENQRDTYDQCLDEVANQVVQALLMQKDLRDECLKLHGRVRDLEVQNRNLRCLFDQNRFKQSIPSPSQSSSHQQYVSYGSTSPGLAGCSIPVLTPSASSHSSPSSASPGLYAPFNHPLRTTKHQRSEPGPSGSTPEGGKDPPLSPRLLQGQAPRKLDHSGSPVKTTDQSKETNPQCDTYQRLVRQQYQQYRHHHSQQQLQQQRTLPQEILRQLSAPANYPASSSPHHAMQQGRTPAIRGLDQMYPFLPYQCEVSGVEGAGEGMGMEDYSWSTSPSDAFPSSMGHSSLPNTPGRMGVYDEALNGNMPLSGSLGARIAKMQVMGEDRLERNSPPEVQDGRNGYILGDQYTKPYVHAPFHYAQSLLKELQEISASVKSFESLTLEPKASHQQKRKANDGQPVLQRQKLAKNFSPSASNASSESLNSATSPKHMMDSTSSMTSTESMETTLERIPPTVLSHGSPLRQEHHLQWRPEYGGNKVPDRTSQFPPDTPSPPTTDIEPSERDYQHSRYLRNRQHSGGSCPERESSSREHESDSKGDISLSSGKGNVNKAIDRYQEKVKNAMSGRRDNQQLPVKNQMPALSMRDKDAINEAQRNLQISQDNEMACGKVSHQPVRDDGIKGSYSVQDSSCSRSVFGRVKAQVQSSSTGYSSEKTKSDEDVLESVTTQVKPKLSRQRAAESVNQNIEMLAGEGSMHLCQNLAESPLEKSQASRQALPQLRDNDPDDMSSPIWKRKSQMEAYRLDEDEKRGDGRDDVDESEDADSRVASFMTAPDVNGKEENGKLLSKYGNEANSKLSPKHYAGKMQSPKSCRKSSLPLPAPSAVTVAMSKPSGAGLSQSVGSIAKADVSVVNGMKSAQSGDAGLDRLGTSKAVMRDESSTTAGTKDETASKPLLSKVEAGNDQGSKSVVKVQGNVVGAEKMRQQIPVRTSREATESLLQKTKMQFNRGEVGRCSLGAKMTQLSKKGAPSPSERPLVSHNATGRGPLAMAASAKAVDVPVLESSPRLPGRRQMTPEHLRNERDSLGDMVEFTSQSIEERASVQSMSTESLQSGNSLGSSADWDSPSKNSSTSQQASTPLGNLLSSDSESEEEEESVNFVDMWKARSTPPIKLPDWDPNKSIEEHRKRMRESLERTESASSASSEQWILSYPIPDDPSTRSGPSSRQSSVGSMTRQDSSNSRSGVACDEDRKILQELLEKEHKAQSRSTSSDSSPEGKKEKQQVIGSNHSLGDTSIMSDFVSSIMAEVKLEDATARGKSKSKGSKDDLTRPKKLLNSPFIRSQSMRAPPKPSRPERTRIPSGGNMDKGKVNSSIPKPQSHSNKSLASVKKLDTPSTKPSKTVQNHSSSDSKKNGSGLTRTFMSKALSRTTNKSASDSPTSNQSQCEMTSPTASEKSGGKSKKANSKSGKGKGKGNDCTPKGKSTTSGAKDPGSANKDSKSKSKIPQLIRQGLKQSPGKTDSTKKKGQQRKEIVVESPKTAPAGSEMLRTEKSSNYNTSAFTEVAPLTKQPSFVVDNVPFIDDSSRSPTKNENPNKTPSPNDEKNLFTSHLDQQGEALCGQSPKLSPRLLQRLRASGIELANSSGSDNDSVFLPDEPRPSTLPIDSVHTCPMGNGNVTKQCQQPERRENGSTSELHLDQKEIEDIKNGLLVSESDALSIGSWSAKSSEFGLKNSFLFGNGDLGNVGTPSNRSLGRGSLDRGSIGRGSLERGSTGRGSLAPSVSSNPEDSTELGRTADDEVDPKKYDVPLVSTEMMEDFEAEDLCDEDGMSSDREKEAQLTEKERANLLDSLFESDDSDGGLDGFLDESNESLLDSHPDEKEFMKLLGDKGMKRQVVRQSVYCRVSLIQMDVFSLYNRFDDQEKEALACFDFLEEMHANNAGETHFTDDHPFSVISPGVRSGNSDNYDGSGGISDHFGSKGTIKDCFDTSLMQAGDTTSSLFGDDPSDATLVGESFTSKGSIGESLHENSGDFTEHFDGDSFSSRHSNKVFDGCYAIGDFSDHLGNRSNLCSSMSSSSTASLSSHE
ncbi:microtubule-associated protein futsch-like [Lytechinus variegatus]|uniref:microtubule-associated protein futsch-like n=1 Tax=Lytechinus variegatus TaxID=7654 RepID=UPI001BB15042|nr:microtubule-associated protein futsch-like [Lytechinus variegatus]